MAGTDCDVLVVGYGPAAAPLPAWLDELFARPGWFCS